MPTYTQEGVQIDDLGPVQVTSFPIHTTEDSIPEVTVVSRFDWQFWAALAGGAVALYYVLKKLKQR